MPETTTTPKQEQDPAKSEWELLDEEEDRKLEELLKKRNADAAPEGEESSEEKPDEEVKEEDEPEEAQEDEPTDTPLEDLTQEELLQRYKDAEKLIEEHRAKAESVEQRYSEAQKRLTEATMSAANLMRQTEALTEIIKKKEAIAAGNHAEPTERPEAKRVEIDTALDELDEEYPGSADKLKPVFKSLQQKIDDQAKTIQKLSGSVESVGKTTAKLTGDEHFNAIEREHPGWENDVNSKEFTDYLASLRPSQRAFAEHVKKQGTTQQAIDLLYDFKERTGHGKNGDKANPSTTTTPKETPQTTTPNDKLERAKREAIPPSKTRTQNINLQKGKPKFTRAEILKMSEAEFIKNEAAIDKAVAAGEVW